MTLKKAVAAALVGALMLIAIALAIAARVRLRPPSAAPMQATAGEAEGVNQNFVGWIPIVVPLSALILVLGAYLILGALAY